MAENWFNKSIEETKKILNTDLENGLSNEEFTKRKEKYGLNELKAVKKKSLLQKFLAQFKDFLQ